MNEYNYVHKYNLKQKGKSTSYVFVINLFNIYIIPVTTYLSPSGLSALLMSQGQVGVLTVSVKADEGTSRLELIS